MGVDDMDSDSEPTTLAIEVVTNGYLVRFNETTRHEPPTLWCFKTLSEAFDFIESHLAKPPMVK